MHIFFDCIFSPLLPHNVSAMEDSEVQAKGSFCFPLVISYLPFSLDCQESSTENAISCRYGSLRFLLWSIVWWVVWILNTFLCTFERFVWLLTNIPSLGKTRWPSIRLGLLSPNKYVAVINTLSRWVLYLLFISSRLNARSATANENLLADLGTIDMLKRVVGIR